MKPTRRPAQASCYSQAFIGLSLALLLAGCSQEPAKPSFAPRPLPADQSPPQVGPPSQAEPGPVAEQVLKVVKDRSGRHSARVVQRDHKKMVICDDQPGPEYDQIGEVAFSEDGLSLAYEAQRGKERFVVLDDREWPLKAAVVHDSFRVSPDNKRLALVALTGDKWQVMVDGRPEPPFDFIFMETLRFSPNSRHTGYLAMKGKKLQAVVNGRARGEWDIVSAGNKALEELLAEAENVEVPPKMEDQQR
ncbi:MAG: hypothetical protein WAU47_09110 [Desulfobaccales bacterium]